MRTASVPWWSTQNYSRLLNNFNQLNTKAKHLLLGFFLPKYCLAILPLRKTRD